MTEEETTLTFASWTHFVEGKLGRNIAGVVAEEQELNELHGSRILR